MGNTGLPAASEVEARTLLDRLFRNAGLRIVNDRFYSEGGVELTLDGYDPERRIGYEYLAAQEQGTDLGEDELKLLGDQRKLLVLKPSSLDEIEDEAKRFLKMALPEGNPEP